MIFSIRVILRNEKMGKYSENQEKIKSQNFKIQDNLVFSIDKNERITKFNDECEKVFGYKKNEVINKFVSDFFIPTRFLNQWKNLFQYSKINKMVDNFKIPFLTKTGKEIIVYWNNFPVKNDKGNVIEIGFVGNLTKSINEFDETLFEYPKPQPDKIKVKKLDTKEKIKVDNYVNKVFKKLKQNNEDLLNKNKDLKKKLEYYENQIEDYKKREDEFEKQNITHNTKLHSFPDVFGGKKKRQEFDKIINELDQRKKDLDAFESILLNEKTILNNKMNELKLWREKLELLNNKLEERWNNLINRENLAINYPSFSNDTENVIVNKNKELKNDYDYFNQIQDSAVIIHRGILKNVNSLFVDLVGYSADEIINKSFFDFIDPEGFVNVEKFYLNRLKGKDISTYETVLLTKNNDKISIEVINKPSFINGEKVDIAIVKTLKKDNKK